MLTRTRRLGFTLVEMLIAIVVLGIVGATLTRVMVNSFRVSQAQVVTADMQSNVRLGGLVLPLELREIGYDSNIYVTPAGTGAITSDLEAIGANSITFRAMRGWSNTCHIQSGLTNIRIRKPTWGQRRPVATDGFLLFVENDFNTRRDDQWVEVTTYTTLDQDVLCGADSAIAINMSGPPEVATGVNLTEANLFVGGPVRYFERMQFGMFVDADGRTYLGARSLSLGETDYRAVAGPLDPAAGLQFTYYDGAGAEVTPGVGDPDLVRSIQVRLQGETGSQVSLMGSSQRETGSMVTVTRVALRNTLNY